MFLLCSDVWGVERDTPIFIRKYGEYENGIKKNE